MLLLTPHRRIALLTAILIAIPVVLTAQQRVEVTRDLWISSHRNESEGNNGGSPKLKLKGIQEFFLIDFDPVPLKGKIVKRAQLHLHLTSPDAPLRRTTVSTITQEWTEGEGRDYEKRPGVSSFFWAKFGEQRWGNDASDITSVVCGEGGSIWGFGDASPPDQEGWQIVPILPEVVQARIDGASQGFFAIDDVGNEYTRDGDAFEYKLFRNRYVSSREDKKIWHPYFTLWLEDGVSATASQTSPAPVTATAVAQLPTAPTHIPSAPALPCRNLFGEPLASTHFFAAKGEAIGFSVPAKLGEVKVDAPSLRVKLYSMPKVADFRDPLVPQGFDLGDELLKEIPSSDGGETFIDLLIPKDTPAGTIQGKVTTGNQTLPFTVTVWNFTLPDHLSFLPQMNAYGLPNHPIEYYRLAHEHRTVLNCLPYGWRGQVHDPVPKIRADQSWDWSEFDAVFAPLLDGSAFSDLPRGPIPVDAFYLMLNENWPMAHEEHFRGGYWIENAYDDTYWSQFRSAAAEIARHIQEKDWTEPMFEFYLNNKIYFKKDDWRKCSAAWIFDEPVHTQDFWAIRRFGQEFWQATVPFPKAHLMYRSDISRPQWQRELFDHCVNVEVVSGILRTYWPRVMRRARDYGNLYYMYGSANAIGTANGSNAAWCVETWSLGADGVVPWNTIGKIQSWTEPDDLSLFYRTPNGPVPSLRLKAFRAGQQLIEYLTQYCTESGQSRDSVMAAIRATPGLSATLVKTSEDDAGKSKFGPETGAALESLRMALGTWLDKASPPAKERWIDIRPARPDFRSARQVTPLSVIP